MYVFNNIEYVKNLVILSKLCVNSYVNTNVYLHRLFTIICENTYPNCLVCSKSLFSSANIEITNSAKTSIVMATTYTEVILNKLSKSELVQLVLQTEASLALQITDLKTK